MPLVYLNGEFLPLAEARIPVMDRGFLFGDGVYEVIPVYSRHPFRLDEHLRRLQNSLNSVRLANPHTVAQWTALIAKIIAAAEFEDQQVYLQVTRGSDNRRNHAFPKCVTPSVLVMSEPLLVSSAEERRDGIHAISATDMRWLRCDIKSTSLLANCLLRQLAVDAGCGETLLFRDGFLSEGTASNIFAVSQGILLAPQKNHLMLPGITYDVVLELATAHGLRIEVRDLLEAEVRQAEELWMTSSTREVLAIISLDSVAIGSGRPGPLYAEMNRWYQEFKATVMRQG